MVTAGRTGGGLLRPGSLFLGNGTLPGIVLMTLADTARRLGFGRLALALWHRPIGLIRYSLNHGGPLVQRGTEQQRREMEAAAATLPPLPTPARDTPLRFHLLTGRRFWYQTVFCLHSLARAAGEPIAAEIYDDGTIDADVAAKLQRLGSAIHIQSHAEILARLEQHLPADRFPVLRDRWLKYPNIRKLTDVHLGSTGWKLVIDSDLLFFRRPALLLDWLRAPDRPLHAIDCTESYGYSRALLERLAGAPLAPLVNVGLTGLQSESLDWPQLEAWTAELIARERTNYYLEQALVAMLVAGRDCTVAPAADYITMPGRDEVLHPTAVMHHYVAHAKRWYFRNGWRHLV